MNALDPHRIESEKEGKVTGGTCGDALRHLGRPSSGGFEPRKNR